MPSSCLNNAIELPESHTHTIVQGSAKSRAPIRKHDYPEHFGQPCFVCRKGFFKLHIILVCRSLTTAQKAARILQKDGIYASVTKAPQMTNPGGCTYGVKIAETKSEAAIGILDRAGIQIVAESSTQDRQRYGERV